MGNTGSVSCGGPCGDQTVSGTGLGAGALYYFFIVLSAMALAWEFYLTAYMARFEGTIRESMKKTLVMVVANLGMVGAFSSCVCAVCSDVQRYTVPDLYCFRECLH